MVALLALALVASAPQSPTPTTASVQAVATVRIISGVRLKLDGTSNADAPTPRDSTIVTKGQAQPARLIEFQ